MKFKPFLMAMLVMLAASSAAFAATKTTSAGSVGGKAKPSGSVNGTTGKPIKHH